MSRFRVRLTLDDTIEIDAMTEEEAVDLAWDQVINEGSWGSEVQELNPDGEDKEDDDGRSD